MQREAIGGRQRIRYGAGCAVGGDLLSCGAVLPLYVSPRAASVVITGPPGVPGLTLIGNAKEKAGVLSFVMEGFRTEEIGDYLNRKGIAVRGGHHCSQPILRRFGLESALRATLALYNTCEEIDAPVAALWGLRQGRSPGLA